MPVTEEVSKVTVSRTRWGVSDSEHDELTESIVLRRGNDGLSILIYKSGKVVFKKLNSKKNAYESEKDPDMPNHELLSKEFKLLFDQLIYT